MRPLFRHSLRPVVHLVLVVGLAAALEGCSLFRSETPAASAETAAVPAKKKGWSILPWGGTTQPTDATPYIEYQRTHSDGDEPMYNLLARNTHPTKTIEGHMRTTMQTIPGDMKIDSQSFTLAPNEQKKLLIYPVRFPLTYEVSASFRE